MDFLVRAFLNGNVIILLWMDSALAGDQFSSQEFEIINGNHFIFQEICLGCEISESFKDRYSLQDGKHL